MRPQNILSDNPSSDQTISDEEDVEAFDDVVSLNASATPSNKEELPLAVRLDFLRGMCDQNLAGKDRSSSFEKPTGIPLEDEVEMPDFKDGEFSNVSGEIVANSSDEEVISEDESHKCGRFGASISNFDRLPEIFKAVDPGASATLDGNYLEDEGKMEINSDTEPAETEALAHGFNLPSIADLFDKLQDKTSLCFPYGSQRKGKSVQLFQKSRFHLQDTIVDSEDSPELVGSGSSSDNEVNDKKMKITFPGKKMQTIADRFQEALGSSSVIVEGTNVAALNSFRAGICEKLQQVMQKEKERDTDFCKQLQTGDSELGCVDVKIISRYLDGKLTVCHCSFGKYTELFLQNFMLRDNSKGMGLGGRESSQITVIFSPRVCDNVDLEVGNLIRIYRPWQEVQVGNDNIILCTYFSEISSTV